ncbi:MAG: prealbumin-like fold domain-containing protein [Lactobacillaceae bacterium]|jgi:hypothetical protein|nr:prealbumin-like fold domain-containing protein [Lactobacillaceae bacterium]
MMRKAKILALVGTLVAPLVLAVANPVLASSKNNEPTKTDVIVHSIMDMSAAGDLNRNQYYSDGTKDGFWNAVEWAKENGLSNSDWQYRANDQFVAWRLPDNLVKYGKVVDGKQNRSIINDQFFKLADDKAVHGKTIWKYSDIFGIEEVTENFGDSPTFNNSGLMPKSDSKQFTIYSKIDYSGTYTSEEILSLRVAISSALDKYWSNKDASVNWNRDSLPTDAQGETIFKDLENGLWVISQQLKASAAELQTAMSVPMIIDLPSMNAGAQNASEYWFDNADNPMHLYAKQYDPTEVAVKKTDAETGEVIKGAKFLLFQPNALNAIEKYLHTIQKEIKQDPSDAANIIATYLQKDPEFADYDLDDLIEMFAVATTDKNGTAMFKQVAGEDTDSVKHNLDWLHVAINGEEESEYYVAELFVPAGHILDQDYDKQAIGYDDQGDTNDTEIHKVVIKESSEGNSTIIGFGKVHFANYDPLAVDKAVTVNGKTFGLNAKNTGDDSEGVARGQIFQWVINADLNRNIDQYSKYKLLDTMPFQTNWLDGTVALTYTDKNGATKSVPLYTLTNNVYPKNAQGIVESEVNTGAGVGYTSVAAGSQVGSDKIAYNASTAPTVTAASDMPAAGLDVYGRTSEYHFDANNRTVDTSKAVKDGKAVLDFNDAARKALNAKIEALLDEGAKDGSWKINWTMDAIANTAAQSEELVNNVTLDYVSELDKGNKSDKTHTFTAGWEIIKTDGNPEIQNNILTNGLAGAGFDLGYKVTKDNLETVVGALYTAATYAGYKDTATAADVDTLRADVNAGKVRWVYFMHTDPATEAPMTHMHSMADSAMGNVLWTLDEGNATTHFSGADGYIQYCGLAAGDYQLIEKVAPTGYKLMTEAYNFTLTKTDKGIIDGKATADDILVANYKGDKPKVTPIKSGVLPITGFVSLFGLMLAGIALLMTTQGKKIREWVKAALRN